MKATGNLNINNKAYWNDIYGDPKKRGDYAVNGTSTSPCSMGSRRFDIALEQISSGQKLLDIGCGVGVFTKLVKQKFPENEVWGVDISDKAIEDNKKENSDITYYQQYIGSLDKIPENYFDVVFTGETLEHLDDPSILLKDAHRALKQDGTLVLTTPLESAIHSGEHVWFFSKEDVAKLFEDNGFTTPEFIDLPDLEYLMVIFAKGRKI